MRGVDDRSSWQSIPASDSFTSSEEALGGSLASGVEFSGGPPITAVARIGDLAGVASGFALLQPSWPVSASSDPSGTGNSSGDQAGGAGDTRIRNTLAAVLGEADIDSFLQLLGTTLSRATPHVYLDANGGVSAVDSAQSNASLTGSSQSADFGAWAELLGSAGFAVPSGSSATDPSSGGADRFAASSLAQSPIGTVARPRMSRS